MIKQNHNKILLILVVSLFLTSAVIFLTTTIVFLYLIITKAFKECYFDKKYDKFIYIFLSFSLILSIINVNIRGLLASIFMIESIFIFFYLRKNIDVYTYNKMLNWMLYGSVIAFGFALTQSGSEYLLNGRAQSTFGNANVYAMICEFIIVICVFKIIETKNSKYVLYMIFNMCGLFITQCRTGWIVLIIAVMTMMLFKKHFRLTLLVVSLCVVALMYTISNDLFPRLGTLAEDIKVRLELWSVGIKGIMEHPLFGQGPFTYAQIYEQYGGQNTIHSHNIYIEFILDFGIIATGFLSIWIYKFYKTIRKENILIVGIITVILIHGIVDCTIFFPATFLMALLIFTNVGIVNVKRIEGTKQSLVENIL